MPNLTFLTESGVGIAIVVIIVEAIKKAGMPKKWLPLFSIAVGIIYGVLVMKWQGYDFVIGILWGLTLAAMSSTGYDTIRGFRKKEFQTYRGIK